MSGETVRGLVLAGGTGSRLRPLTHTGAKQLVPVANVPVLFWVLRQLAEAGIVEVGIVVGATGDEVRAAVGDGTTLGVKATYIEQGEPLGLADAVRVAGDFLGDDDFLMYLGDNLLEHGVTGFVERFEASRHAGDRPRLGEAPRTRPAARILLAEVDDPTRFGVAELGPDGDVASLVEKPEVPPSNLALVGAYLFDRHIHDAVRAIRPSARGELEITDAIQWLIDHGHRVDHDLLEGWWIDTGKVTPLLEANRLLVEQVEPAVLGRVGPGSRLEGRVRIEEGAEVVDSVVRGPAVIGVGARIERAYVGPFSAVGDGCVVIEAEVEHSILLAGARVEGHVRLVDSIIGRDAVVGRSDQRPQATRLVIGDHSQVDLPGSGR